MTGMKQAKGHGMSGNAEHEKPIASGSGANAVKQSNGTASGASKKPADDAAEASGGVAVPNWKGPQPDATSTVMNGDPFKKTAATNGNKAKADAPKATPITFLNRDSEADDGPSKPTIVRTPTANEQDMTATVDKGKGKVITAQQPVGTRGAKVSPTRAVFFTTDVGLGAASPGGHYVKAIIRLDKGVTIAQAIESLNVELGWEKKVLGSTCTGPTSDTNDHQVIFCFDDIREAAKAINEATMVNTKWEAVYVTQHEYATGLKSCGHGEETSFYDGQVVFAAQPHGEAGSFDDAHLFDDIKNLASHFGTTLCVAQAEIVKGTWTFKAEYYKISDAKKTIASLAEAKPAQLKAWTVYARQRQLSPQDDLSVKPMTATPHRIREAEGTYFESPTGRTAYRQAQDGTIVPMPPPTKIPRHNVAVDEYGAPSELGQFEQYPHTPNNGYGYPPTPRTGSSQTTATPRGSSNGQRGSFHGHRGNFHGHRGPRSQFQGLLDNNTGSEPQVIDREKLVAGTDTRTTIMLRNLPPTLGIDRLHRILDTVTKARYNFTYLRMDFSKNTNVGYAFVNFVTSDDVLTFYDFWVGTPWCPEMNYERHRGPRIAACAYAVIQSSEGSVEKFRNSSVMDESPDCQPHLFWTVDDAPQESMIGEIKPFPAPDNMAKLQRSRDNAGQIGLFASPRNGGRGGRGGRGGGDRYRAQRSQYDRGTLAQINEDEAYDQASPYYHHGYPPMHMGPPLHMHPMGYGGYNGYAHPAMYGEYGFANQGPYGGYPQFDNMDPFATSRYGEPMMHAGGAVQSPMNGRRYYQNGFQNGNGFGQNTRFSGQPNGGGYAHTIRPTQYNGNGSASDDRTHAPKGEGYGNGQYSHRQ